VLDHSAVRTHYPDLVEALSQLATVQVRNMGTIAGNLCNASPCADSAPPLLAHDAQLTLVGPDGTRSLALTEFFLGPGQTARAAGEILSSIQVPPPPAATGFAFRSISARSKVDMSAVSVGVMIRIDGDRIGVARIFLGAVGPTALRASSAESVLSGKPITDDLATEAAAAAAEDAKPISDVRASAWWRRRMVAVLTRRAILAAFERAAS
jgi:carbon-monoxide dehydrogenase medium subunit